MYIFYLVTLYDNESYSHTTLAPPWSVSSGLTAQAVLGRWCGSSSVQAVPGQLQEKPFTSFKFELHNSMASIVLAAFLFVVASLSAHAL